MTEPGALAGLTVVDLSERIGGQFATRLMADYGADVVLVEPPAGSALRAAGGSLFRHLNAGKRSRALDPDEDAGWAALVPLCAGADVTVLGDPALAARLAAACPATLVALVTDFGTTGPYRGWLGGELVHQALSGSMYMNGLAHREPLYGVGERASYSAGLWLYVGVLAALHRREVDGTLPGPVEVTVHEAAAAMEQNFSTQWAYNGTFPWRGERVRTKSRARCRGGWISYFVQRGQWPLYCALLGAPDLADDPRFHEWPELVRNWREAAELLAERAPSVDLEQVLRVAAEHRLVLAPMLGPRALRHDEHLVAREFWRGEPTPDGPRLALGPVFRMSATPADRDRPAPALGELDGDPGWPERMEAPAVGSTGLPLTGIAVLDFTSAWAGPMATRILASLGADIIKIEGPARPDGWRGEWRERPSATGYYPDLDPGKRPYDRDCWFNSQNHDKRSVVLDLRRPEAVELVRALLPRMDAVIANFSPGVLDRLGLGWERASGLNPRLVMVEMPAAGNTGPRSRQRGLGPTMEAMAGIAGLIGYPDEGPVGSGTAYLDPIGALHGAAALLTALLHRTRHGRADQGGQYVEVAQQEAAMHWIGEIVLEAIETGADPVLQGNARPDACPHGAFRTAGDDEWIAVAAASDDQWRALCAELGLDDLGADPELDAVAGRVAARDRIEAELAEAVRDADKHALAERLQRAGVPAAPVQNGRDLHADPHLRERDWFARLHHPEAGTHDYPGLPIRFAGRRPRPAHPSPTFGQHTAEVLSEYLGLDDDDLARLAADRVTATEPGRR
ncbi:CaiB/BaiF CoA-transferase family protein [Pseudonocardia humida]|uniref:CoA transferase n=1 Tax=Pseudonocardia humida TaxID=2800819 RepID=A0ABT1A207_9PSEU|nr:CoA transferase [Pseudonocardia humida]MCO1657030.1 CoA transferase [Pseudonocardia humida]